MSSPAADDAPSPAVRLAGVRKSFDGTVANDDLTLDVRGREVLALLGPSGCGKSTTLRLIAGLLVPDAGTVEIRGRVVAGPGTWVSPEDRHVGLVFQDYALFPHLSVTDNVAFGLKHLSRDARRLRVADVLTLVGMEELGDRLPAQLSGGQQQRVAIARALAPEPSVLLLDEPFSNLDASLRTAVREDLRRILVQAGVTTVFVTHDQEEALSLADRVAVMEAGRLHQVDDPVTLYNRPATRFVAEFVGEADVLPATRAGQFFVDTIIGRLETQGPVTADVAHAVVRPEALEVRPTQDGPGTVEAVQYFGHDQLIHVRLPDGLVLRSRQGPLVRVAQGDRVSVSVTEKILAFA
ncbi:MAG: ABC transporter ATP-binding protein [Nitriliruptorales bacterium]|nr:ABC transporter ATP-binding protein [Nitriliruptorales bacterium]